MQMQKRTAGMVLLLSIVTCGIYFYYWIYVASQEITELSGQPEDMSPAMEVLLTVLTCGLYSIYWYYKSCHKINAAYAARGAQANDNTIICLVLPLVGFGCISAMIVQDQINGLIDLAYPGAPTQM